MLLLRINRFISTFSSTRKIFPICVAFCRSEANVQIGALSRIPAGHTATSRLTCTTLAELMAKVQVAHACLNRDSSCETTLRGCAGACGPPSLQHQELRQHLRCSECGAAFHTSQRLSRHVARHRRRLPFKCDVCDTTFARKHHLVTHRLLHTGQRPFRCDTCGLTFTQAGSLARHRRGHTGERPYPCDVCGKAFVQSSALDIHKRSHTGERPYPCDVCGGWYISSRDLAVHKRRHTGERPIVAMFVG